MISKEMRDNRWNPIQISKNGPKISHLFFADDVLLFAKAKVSQAKVIKEVLDSFCSLSGLKVSEEKSKVFASIGVQRTKKDKIKQVTRFMFTTNLEKYPGFKFFHGRIKKEDFVDVLNRVH